MDTRPLPRGWIATFDDNYKTTFYVLTTVDPPQSSWLHPDDNPQYAARPPAGYTPRTGPPPGEAPDGRPGIPTPPGSGDHGVFTGRPRERSFGDQPAYGAGIPPPAEEKKSGLGGMFKKLKSLVDDKDDARPDRYGSSGGDQRSAYQSSPYAQPPLGGPTPQLIGQQQQTYGADPQAHYSQGYGQPSYGQPQGEYYAQQDDRGMFGGGSGQMSGYQQNYGQHQQQQKSGGIGMGGIALAGAGGLVGGVLLADALDGDDDENEAYREGYQDAMDDADDGGDDDDD